MGIVAVLTVDSYYTGYAKFFDVTDDSCDKVTWHIYNELRTRAYLTQEKRQQMNDLVDLMNKRSSGLDQTCTLLTMTSMLA
jgi:hypothetical protein